MMHYLYPGVAFSFALLQHDTIPIALTTITRLHPAFQTPYGRPRLELQDMYDAYDRDTSNSETSN